MIERRLDLLSERARDLLKAGAVLGQVVPLDLWQQVTRADDAESIETLKQGRSLHLLREGTSDTSWLFAHALVRQILYEDLMSLQRRDWHRRAAEALVASPNADPDEVAYHFQQAHDPQAIEWLVRAAERAERAYDWNSAVDRFKLLLAQISGDAKQDRLRGWILVHLARLLRSSDAQQGVRYSEDACRIAEHLGDRVLTTVAMNVRGHLRCFEFDTEQGVRDLVAGTHAGQDLTDNEWRTSYRLQRSVLELCCDEMVPQDLPTTEVARVTSEQVGLLVLWLATGTLRWQEAIDRGGDYASLLATLDEQSLLKYTSSVEGGSWIDTYLGLGNAYAALGRLSEARAAFGTAFTLYRQAGHHVLAACVPDDILTRLHLPYRADYPEERDRLMKTSAELLGAGAGALDRDFTAEYLNTRALYLAGKWAHARAFAEHARDHWRSSAIGFQEAPLGSIAWRQGRREEAWQVINGRYPDGPNTRVARTVPHYAMEVMRLAIDLSLDASDLESAYDWLKTHDRWLEISNGVSGRSDGVLLWARYHLAKGDSHLSHQQCDEALVLANDPRQPLALIAVHRFLGRLDTEAHRFDVAEQHLQESFVLAGACAAPFERALRCLSWRSCDRPNGEPTRQPSSSTRCRPSASH